MCLDEHETLNELWKIAFNHGYIFLYKDKEAAEDHAQEVVSKFLDWTDVKGIPPLEFLNHQGMLRVISRNHFIDRYRARRAQEKKIAAYQQAEKTRPAEELDGEILDGRELSLLLQRAIAGFPHFDRHVFDCLRQGFSQREISTELGCSIGKVKAAVRRGYAKLRGDKRLREFFYADTRDA